MRRWRLGFFVKDVSKGTPRGCRYLVRAGRSGATEWTAGLLHGCAGKNTKSLFTCNGRQAWRHQCFVHLFGSHMTRSMPPGVLNLFPDSVHTTCSDLSEGQHYELRNSNVPQLRFRSHEQSCETHRSRSAHEHRSCERAVSHNELRLSRRVARQWLAREWLV
jgi:hypothetical protein